MIKTRRRYFGNVVGHVKGVDDMTSLSDWVSGQFDPSLTWKDIEGLRMNWDRKLVIKGIMDPDDAKLILSIRKGEIPYPGMSRHVAKKAFPDIDHLKLKEAQAE